MPYNHMYSNLFMYKHSLSALDGDTFPMLLVVLGAIVGSILLILLVILVYVCCTRRAARDGRNEAVRSESTYSLSAYGMPRPAWLHWNDKRSALIPQRLAPMGAQGQQRNSLPPGVCNDCISFDVGMC